MRNIDNFVILFLIVDSNIFHLFNKNGPETICFRALSGIFTQCVKWMAQPINCSRDEACER